MRGTTSIHQTMGLMLFANNAGLRSGQMLRGVVPQPALSSSTKR